MVRLTDHLGMTIAVDWDVKQQTKQKKMLDTCSLGTMAISEDQDEMSHTAFHQGLHCCLIQSIPAFNNRSVPIPNGLAHMVVLWI